MLSLPLQCLFWTNEFSLQSRVLRTALQKLLELLPLVCYCPKPMEGKPIAYSRAKWPTKSSHTHSSPGQNPPVAFNLTPYKWKSSQNPKPAALVTSLICPILLPFLSFTPLLLHGLLGCFLNARHAPNLGTFLLLISLPEMLFPEMIPAWPTLSPPSGLDSKITYPVRSSPTTLFKIVGLACCPSPKSSPFQNSLSSHLKVFPCNIIFSIFILLTYLPLLSYKFHNCRDHVCLIFC